MARAHEALFPVCEELNVAFSPMANDFLTGAYQPGTQFIAGQDYRATMSQYTQKGYSKARDLLELLTRVAEEKGAAMGQISLSWMFCKKPYIVLIPGSRKLDRLRENFAAGEIVLTPEEINAIDAKLDTMDFAVFGGHSGK